ncbi:MAG: hypothetical protein ACK5HS_02730 [Mycoplasmatales bacterium]
MIYTILTLVLSVIIFLLSSLNLNIEVYTGFFGIIITNLDIIIAVLVLILFYIRNANLKMMIFSANKVTKSYVFYYLASVIGLLLVIFSLVQTSKISALYAFIIVTLEFLYEFCNMFGIRSLLQVNYFTTHVRIKELSLFLVLFIMFLSQMPFAFIGWPILLISFLLYVGISLNLIMNNLRVLLQEIE